jgi:hypothetical protein
MLRGKEDGSALYLYIWRQYNQTYQMLFGEG